MIKSAYIYLSDKSEHGWYSAVPIYKKYIKLRKSELNSKHGITFDLNIIFSDRGPSDFWCAPFIYEASKVAKSESVEIIEGTTASGHGKEIHDQIGGGTKTKTKYGSKNGYIKYKSPEKIAEACVEYLTANYSESISGSIHRYFFVIEPKEIEERPSPIQSFVIGHKSGITDFHCCRIDKQGHIQFKKYFCSCDTCIANRFIGNCDFSRYCGTWMDIKPIKHKSTKSKSKRSSKSKSISKSPHTNIPIVHSPKLSHPKVTIKSRKRMKPRPQTQQITVKQSGIKRKLNGYKCNYNQINHNRHIVPNNQHSKRHKIDNTLSIPNLEPQ